MQLDSGKCAQTLTGYFIIKLQLAVNLAVEKPYVGESKH